MAWHTGLGVRPAKTSTQSEMILQLVYLQHKTEIDFFFPFKTNGIQYIFSGFQNTSLNLRSRGISAK